MGRRLSLEAERGRERAFLSWTRASKKASSFYGNVGEEEKWISWRCCAPSAGVKFGD